MEEIITQIILGERSSDSSVSSKCSLLSRKSHVQLWKINHIKNTKTYRKRTWKPGFLGSLKSLPFSLNNNNNNKANKTKQQQKNPTNTHKHSPAIGQEQTVCLFPMCLGDSVFSIYPIAPGLSSYPILWDGPALAQHSNLTFTGLWVKKKMRQMIFFCKNNYQCNMVKHLFILFRYTAAKANNHTVWFASALSSMVDASHMKLLQRTRINLQIQSLSVTTVWVFRVMCGWWSQCLTEQVLVLALG